MRNNDYRGPVKAVILDWAGTTVDYGCFAPTGVFIEVFRQMGIQITVAEARGPMGKYKRDHIKDLTELPRIAIEWEKKYGRPCREEDIDKMFGNFIPLQLSVLKKYSEIVPELPEALKLLRSMGIKIGSTTGYTDEMMKIVTSAAATQGYIADSVVCVSDVPSGRPSPWMAFRNAEKLNVYPMEAIVKIGDTIADIHEGNNSGMWSVGVVKSGNEMGLTLEEVKNMDPFTLTDRISYIRNLFYDSGADYVINSLEDMGTLLEHINERLSLGEKPGS